MLVPKLVDRVKVREREQEEKQCLSSFLVWMRREQADESQHMFRRCSHMNMCARRVEMAREDDLRKEETV